MAIRPYDDAPSPASGEGGLRMRALATARPSMVPLVPRVCYHDSRSVNEQEGRAQHAAPLRRRRFRRHRPRHRSREPRRRRLPAVKPGQDLPGLGWIRRGFDPAGKRRRGPAGDPQRVHGRRQRAGDAVRGRRLTPSFGAPRRHPTAQMSDHGLGSRQDSDSKSYFDKTRN